MVDCCKLLGVGILCSWSCPCRSDHHVPVNLDKTTVTLCSTTFYLYTNRKVYTFKDQSLENGLSCIFQGIGNILNLWQKQQNTKIKVKETELIWSQICSSLL